MITKSKLKRVPVIYKGESLMPTTQGRAYHLVREGKGVFVYDKHIGWYLKLKKRPSGFHKQRIALGIDTGTMFLGFSVVGKDISTNLEFEQTQKLLNRDYIKNHSDSRLGYRKFRRSRLCHRESRFLNRTGNKITSTSNYIYQNIRNCVNWLIKYYPISDIAVEDVRYNHYWLNKGGSFSPIEQIKTRLYKFLRTKVNLIISTENPKKLREFTNLETGNKVDLKSRNKADKSFYAHCIDSHSLTQLVFGYRLPFTEDVRYIFRFLPNIDRNRRKLGRLLTIRNSKPRRHSKFRKVRVKVKEDQGNHGPWEYMSNPNYENETYPKGRYPYGSSICKSNQHGNLIGANKYRVDRLNEKYTPNDFYRYYDIQNFKTSKISSTLSYNISG